jgi:predicted ATP-binding protein involved in virulence
VRIDRLEIKNFKKFSDFTIDLHPQFTLLVGDNGTGKTTILDALAIASGVWLVKAPDSTLSRNILSNEIHLEVVKTGDRISFDKLKPVEIRATGSIVDCDAVSWLRQIYDGGSRTSNIGTKEAVRIITNLFERDKSGEKVWFPVIAYYGAGRTWLPSNKRDRKIEISPSHRWEAFYDCFDERIRLPDLQNWFQKETMASVNRQGRMRPGYNVVKFAILRCIPGADNIWFDVDLLELVISINHHPQLFSNLSAGQKMMVALIADIAIKIVTQNSSFLPEESEIDNDILPLLLQRTSGLVLIDEIDVHLHPKWQRQVVHDLKSTFPAIQFVCTTHSPFIIQSIAQGELRSFDTDDVQLLEYENQSIEDIAESIQSVDSPQQSSKARELDIATEKYFTLLQSPESNDPGELEKAELAYRKAVQPFSSNPGLSAFLKLEAMAKEKQISEIPKRQDV